MTPPRVRLEIRAGGDVISTPVSASYGFEEATGDVQPRPAADEATTIEANTVTLMLTGETTQKTVTIALVDAETGATLASLADVEMAIAL